MAVKKLDARETRFVQEYIVDLDPKRAALAAGYSETIAKSKAYQWVSVGKAGKATKPHVLAAIQEAQRTRGKENVGLEKAIINELAIIALADIGDVFTVDNNGKVLIRNLSALKPEVRRTISEITQVTTERKVNRRRVPYGMEGSGDDGDPDYSVTEIESVRLGVKQHNKLTAINLLMQHFGMLAPTKHDVTVTAPLKERLASKVAEALARRKCSPTS